MKVTLYRYEKETLVMRSVEMEKLQAALRTENLNKPVSTTRDKAMFALPGTQNSYIQKLPVVVFGGTFRKTGEPAPPMRDYSGLVLLEVNHLSDLQEAVQIRQQAAMMPQTLLAFVGFSGKSVKIVIPFTLPDGTLPRSPEQVKRFHSQAYLTAVKYYQPQLGRNITLKEPVLQHGCRMSYDPQPVYNPDAVAIRIEQPMRMADSEEIRIVPEEPSEPLQRLMPGMSRNYRIATLFSIAMVDAIRKSGQIKDGDLKPVFTLLADNCLKAGIPEEDTVQCTLLYNDLKSKEMEIRMTFRSVYTLKEALAGKTFMPEIMSLTLQLEEFMLRRYEIRNNKMSGEVEYRDKSLLRFTFSPFTREVRNSICTEAHKEGLNVWDKDIERYVYSDNIPTFFPIEEYLGHLPKWDGKDHIRKLAKRVPCNNIRWADHFHRWFLSMVAHWLGLDREHGNSTTPLLVGDQGCGKSTYCLNILPPELRQFYTDSIDFSKKRDAELYLTRFGLINIDEFDQVSARHQGFLKHLLQKPVVNVRKPHATQVESVKRYASFIATSNHTDLLGDPSGSRRFICIEVKGMIDNAQPIDYLQLYAQAVAALKNNERYWLTHEEEASQMQANEAFQQRPLFEDLFFQYYRPASHKEEGLKISAGEIYLSLQKKSGVKLPMSNVSVFGRFLKKIGLKTQLASRGRLYLVVEK